MWFRRLPLSVAVPLNRTRFGTTPVFGAVGLAENWANAGVEIRVTANNNTVSLPVVEPADENEWTTSERESGFIFVPLPL